MENYGELLNQFLHGGVIIVAVFAFIVFFLNQIRKSIQIKPEYGKKIMTIVQPKQEWITIGLIDVIGAVVVWRLIGERMARTSNMEDSYYTVIFGAIIFVAALLVFLTIRAVNSSKIFEEGILVHDYGYIKWDNIKSVDKMPKGRFKLFIVKPDQFKSKEAIIPYTPEQEDELIEIFRKNIN